MTPTSRRGDLEPRFLSLRSEQNQNVVDAGLTWTRRRLAKAGVSAQQGSSL